MCTNDTNLSSVKTTKTTLKIICAISCYDLFTFLIRSLCRTIFWWSPESPQGTSGLAAAYPSLLWQNAWAWNGWTAVQRGRKDSRDQSLIKKKLSSQVWQIGTPQRQAGSWLLSFLLVLTLQGKCFNRFAPLFGHHLTTFLKNKK